MLNDTQFVIQDPIFATQLQELAHYFCNIQNEHIRNYAINLIKEVSQISDANKAKEYCDDVLN